MLDQVKSFIETNGTLDAKAPILLGVSGGVDSMVMMDVMRRLAYQISVVHINYGLRGEASDADADLVENICAQFDIPFFYHRVTEREVYELEGKGLQEKARILRYKVFSEIACDQSISYIGVGHNKEDQAETVLMHLFRGSGLEGLLGMLPERKIKDNTTYLLRPLLSVSRTEIEKYASDRDIPWRDDLSNETNQYRRGTIRNRIVPFIEAELGTEVTGKIVHTAAVLRSYYDDSFLHELSLRFEACIQASEKAQTLSIKSVLENEEKWQNRIILEAFYRWMPGVSQTGQALETVRCLLNAQVGKRVLFTQGTVWRERSSLRFQTGPANVAQDNVLISKEGVFRLGNQYMTLSLHDGLPRSLRLPSTFALLDEKRYSMPLEWRRWQPGDRLTPLGMHGKSKRVSDILTDAKIPSAERKQASVLCSEGHILWVVGQTISQHVRLTDETTSYLQCTWVQS